MKIQVVILFFPEPVDKDKIVYFPAFSFPFFESSNIDPEDFVFFRCTQKETRQQ